MLCTTWVQPGTCRGQERIAGPFVLEFQMVVSHRVGAENPAPRVLTILGEAAGVLNY